MAKKQTANHQSNVMYQQVVGTCTIKMMLDKRNSSRYADGIFPLAIRFTINDERYYHKLGDSFSGKELAAIKASTGQGEKHNDDAETRYQIKTRLPTAFDKYVDIVQQLDETGSLSLERIKTGLTGKCRNNSFVEMWKMLIEEKISIPVGGSRKEDYLPIEKMTELYYHWKERDLDLPQYLLSVKKFGEKEKKFGEDSRANRV